MKSKFFTKSVVPFFWEIVGSALIAIGIYNFAVAAEFPMTGFSGIALIFYRLFHFPIGWMTILLNIPVSVLCYKLLGKTFFIRSIRCMLISSLMTDYIAPYFPIYEGNRLLAALCTGTIAGLGYALIYMQNSSTAGSDFIIMAIKSLKPHIALGKIIFFTDIVIIIIAGIIFRDVDGIIYGFIISYLFSVVVDKTMYGINAGKVTLIVTSNGKLVADTIENVARRGSTLLKAVGGYKHEEKDVVMCACSNKQMYAVQKAVKDVDPDSFMVILESNEVHGEGFEMLQLGETK